MAKTQATAEKGMIFLDTHHPIIVDTLTQLFGVDEEPKKEPVDVKACDFDDVEYRILVTPEEKDFVSLSMKMKCTKDLMPMGAKMLLDQTFGQALQDKTESGYDVTLKWNVNNVKADAKKIIQQAAELKRLVLGSPFERCFEALANGQSASLKPMTIKYRPKETIYLAPSADRVLVFFSMDFLNETDRAIATVFLQEFQSAQNRNQAAPAVTFTKDAPGQLKSVQGFKEDVSCIGYVMFTLFKMHVDKPEKIKNAAALLSGFRSYIVYHVKGAKTYLQSRMRMRSELMLKILNRANPEAAEMEKNVGRRNTATVTTKTFRRF